MANWKTKDYAPNDSKHSLASICSHFIPEWNFDSTYEVKHPVISNAIRHFPTYSRPEETGVLIIP